MAKTATPLRAFPIDVPAVTLASYVLPSDHYAIHVLPFQLERVRAGFNEPTVAIRRQWDGLTTMLVVRGIEIPPKQGASMHPEFNSPLPGSTTVLWVATHGTVRVWHEEGKQPNWIALAGSKTETLALLLAEVTR